MRHIRSQWFRRKEQERKRRAYFRHDVGKFKREIFNYEACESSFLSHDQSETRYSRSSGKRHNLHQRTSCYRKGDNQSECQNRDYRLVNFDDTRLVNFDDTIRYQERYNDVFDVNYAVEVASEVCYEKHDQNEWIRKRNYFGQLSDSNLTSKSDSMNEKDFQRVTEENCVRDYERSISHTSNEGGFNQHYENRLRFESQCPYPEFSECTPEKMHNSDFPYDKKEEVSSFNDKDCRHIVSGKTDFSSENDFKFRCQSFSTIETLGHERFVDDSAWQQNKSLPMAIDWGRNQSLPTSDSVTGQFNIPTAQPPILPLSVSVPSSQWTVPTLHPSSPSALPVHDQNNNYRQTCTKVQNTVYSFQNKRQDLPHTNLPYAYPHMVANFSTEIVKQRNIQNKGPASKQFNYNLSSVSNSVSSPSLNANTSDYFDSHQEEWIGTCSIVPERGTPNNSGYHGSADNWNNMCHTAGYTQRNSPMSANFEDDKTMALPSNSTDIYPDLLANQSDSIHCSSLTSYSSRMFNFQDTLMFSSRDKIFNKEHIEKSKTHPDVKPGKRTQNEKEERDRKRYHGVYIEEKKPFQDLACNINYNDSIEENCVKDDQKALESSKNGTEARTQFAHSFSWNCDSSNFDKSTLLGTKNTKENIFRPWTSSLEYNYEEISSKNSNIDCDSRKNLQYTGFGTDDEGKQFKQGEEYDDKKLSPCTNSAECKKENELYKVNHQNLKMRDLKNFVHSKLKPTLATEISESTASTAAFDSHQKSNEKLKPSGKDNIMRTWSEAYIKKPGVGVLERSQKGLNQNRMIMKNYSKATSKGKKSFDSKQVENREALSPLVKTDQKKFYIKSKQKRKSEFGADIEKKPCNSNIHPKLRHKINSQVALENETLTSSCSLTNTISPCIGKLKVKSSKNSHCAKGDMTAHKSPNRRKQSEVEVDKTSKTTIETLNKRKHSLLFQNPKDCKTVTKRTTDRVSSESSFDKIHTLEGKNSHSSSVAGHIKSDDHSNNQKLDQSVVSKKKNTNRNEKEKHTIHLKAVNVKSMKDADTPLTNPNTKFTVDQPKNSTSINSDILSSQVPIISSTYHEPYRIENPKVREMKHPKEEDVDQRHVGPIHERKETTSVKTEGAESNKKRENFENNSMSSDFIVDVPSSGTDSKPTTGEKNPIDLQKTEETPEKNDKKLPAVSNPCNNSCNNQVNRTLTQPFSVRDPTDKSDNCFLWPETSIITPVPFDTVIYSQNKVYPDTALPVRDRSLSGCLTLPYSMNMTFNFASDLHLKYVQAKRELEVIDSRRSFLVPLSGQVKDQLPFVSSSGMKQCLCKTDITEKNGKNGAYLDKTVDFRQDSPKQKKFDDHKKMQWHKCLEVDSSSVHCSHEKLDSVVESRSQSTVWVHDTDQVKEESTCSSNTASTCENLSDFVRLPVPFECDSTTQTNDEVINIGTHANTDYEGENGIHRVIEQVITEKCLCSTDSPEIIDDLSWISDERLHEIANGYDGLESDVSDNKESVERETNYCNTTQSRSFRVSSRRRHRYSKRFPTCLPRMKKEKCQSEKALYESAVKFLGDFDKTNKRACRQAKQVEEPKVVAKRKNVPKKDCSPKGIDGKHELTKGKSCLNSKNEHLKEFFSAEKMDGKNELTEGNSCLNSKNEHIKEHQENLKTDISVREYSGSVMLKNDEIEESPHKVVEKLKIADLLSKYKLKAGKLESGKLVSMRQHFDKRSRTNIAGGKDIDTICNKTPVVKMENLNDKKKFALDKKSGTDSVEKHNNSENIKPYNTCGVCKMSVYTNMQYHFQRFHKSWCFRCQKDFKEFDLMKRHIRRNHDIPIFCGLCGVTFLYRSSYHKHCNSTLHQENIKKNTLAKQVPRKSKIGTAKTVPVPSRDGKPSCISSVLNISTPGLKDIPASVDKNVEDLESKPLKNSTAPSLDVKKSGAKLKFCEVCKKFYKVLHAHMKTEKHLQNMKMQKQEARRKKIQAKLMQHKEIREKNEKEKLKIKRCKAEKESGPGKKSQSMGAKNKKQKDSNA